ncbi:hypothetical protein T4B_4036 [Trichinella pseudospiralis]|uniref:Uncharacterized protein n=1 Tax=Trichinella pseudospiralis TaxID=6337 RepID=A0A0V1IAS8_TRIPS|nr:hypothetical protein T4B_4036 [Trichinella pseudospiralis]
MPASNKQPSHFNLHQSSSAPSSHHHHRHLDNQLRKSPESNISKKELRTPALIFQTGHYKNGVTDGICFYNL